jgi:hypothetical protein
MENIIHDLLVPNYSQLNYLFFTSYLPFQEQIIHNFILLLILPSKFLLVCIMLLMLLLFGRFYNYLGLHFFVVVTLFIHKPITNPFIIELIKGKVIK